MSKKNNAAGIVGGGGSTRTSQGWGRAAMRFLARLSSRGVLRNMTHTLTARAGNRKRRRQTCFRWKSRLKLAEISIIPNN